MTNRFQRLWVGSNHKMYKTNRQTLAYLETLQKLTADIPRDRLTLFVLPPYTALSDACQFVDHSLVQIGAQNMHWAEYGQYTGEISAPMLEEIGVDLVMCGHAERRASFGDTNQTVNRRVLTSVAHGFQTLLCVGETIEDKMEGTSVERLREQVCRGVQGLNPSAASQLRLAYEPVWAIGEQGESPDPEYVNAMHVIIRDALIRFLWRHRR